MMSNYFCICSCFCGVLQNHPGGKHLVAARNWINSVPQAAAAMTFAFSSVFILLLSMVLIFNTVFQHSSGPKSIYCGEQWVFRVKEINGPQVLELFWYCWHMRSRVEWFWKKCLTLYMLCQIGPQFKISHFNVAD